MASDLLSYLINSNKEFIYLLVSIRQKLDFYEKIEAIKEGENMLKITLFDYFPGNEVAQFTLSQIPQQLTKNSKFRSLPTDAKLLYGMRLDRMGLSAKNDWHDNTGRVYIYYTVERCRTM